MDGFEDAVIYTTLLFKIVVVADEINGGSVLHWCRAIIFLTNNSCGSFQDTLTKIRK